jgi:hypothetical protein
VSILARNKILRSCNQGWEALRFLSVDVLELGCAIALQKVIDGLTDLGRIFNETKVTIPSSFESEVGSEELLTSFSEDVE